MMALQFNLSIPKPCSQEYASMEDVEKGKFCQNCQKEVIDFELLSQTQQNVLIQSGTTCVRISSKRLKEPFRPREEAPSRLNRFYLLMGSLFLFGNNSRAQVNPPEQPINIEAADYYPPGQQVVLPPLPDTLTIRVSVRVVSGNEPLAFALVRYGFPQREIMTDFEGMANIRVKTNQVNWPLNLECRYLSFEPVVKVIDLPKQLRGDRISVSFEMFEKTAVIVGELISVPERPKRNRFLPWNWFRKR